MVGIFGRSCSARRYPPAPGTLLRALMNYPGPGLAPLTPSARTVKYTPWAVVGCLGRGPPAGIGQVRRTAPCAASVSHWQDRAVTPRHSARVEGGRPVGCRQDCGVEDVVAVERRRSWLPPRGPGHPRSRSCLGRDRQSAPSERRGPWDRAGRRSNTHRQPRSCARWCSRSGPRCSRASAGARPPPPPDEAGGREQYAADRRTRQASPDDLPDQAGCLPEGGDPLHRGMKPGDDQFRQPLGVHPIPVRPENPPPGRPRGGWRGQNPILVWV